MPPPHDPSLHPTHLADLLSHITPYLTVSIHHLLYLRGLYPSRAFLRARAYNFPVWQCRHPAVCAWVTAAAEGVAGEMLRLGGGGDRGVRSVAWVVFEAERDGHGGAPEAGSGGAMRVKERWVFDVSGLPSVPRGEESTDFEGGVAEPTDATPKHRLLKDSGGELVALEEQFRAALARMGTASARLGALEGVAGGRWSYSVVLEVGTGSGPVSSMEKGRGNEGGAWVAGEVAHRGQDSGVGEEEESGEEGGSEEEDAGEEQRARVNIRTVPIRRVESGELRMEMWVEEVR